MKQWIRRHGMAMAIGVGALSFPASVQAAPGPQVAVPEPSDGDKNLEDDVEPEEGDEAAPLPGKPLTADELAAFERVMTLHETMLTALEAHRKDAPGAAKALTELARRDENVLAQDGHTLAVIKRRIVDENDVQASLSIPEALLDRITRSCGRWLSLGADIDRMLAHEPFADAMMRFAIDIL